MYVPLSHLLASTHSLDFPKMDSKWSPKYRVYDSEKTSNEILFTYFEWYDYSEHDDTITPNDEYNKQYLEQIDAWEYIIPTEAERKLLEMQDAEMRDEEEDDEEMGYGVFD